jgi:hypothetical protein
MRSGAVWVLSATLLCASDALAQTIGEQDTMAAARLSAAEVQQITAALEPLAYDWPDSWTVELRAKRVDLGQSPGLVLTGTHLLCGATGNCQLFVLRKVNGIWTSLFGDEEAPLAESFQLGPHRTHGIKDLTVVTNLSAESAVREIYQFDGEAYRRQRKQ